MLCGVETLVEKFMFGTMVRQSLILLAIFLFLIGIQSVLALADLQMGTFCDQDKRAYLVKRRSVWWP